MKTTAQTLLSRYWISIFLLVYGGFTALPFLAPVLIQAGWQQPAKLIYLIYSFVCHQLPERSFFLFGPRFSYSLAEIQANWQATSDPLILRQFIGSPALGWKVAWSDRMVWLYGSVWLFALLWWLVGRPARRISWQWAAVLAVPLLVDGGTHLVSDMSGLYQGFRYTNAWLAGLTRSALPTEFYLGDAWGSFNALMRLLTSLPFSFGLVWLVFPYLEAQWSSAGRDDELKGVLP
jgi:uncharacterized membrane protein